MDDQLNDQTAYGAESIAVGAADERTATGTRDIATPLHLSATYGVETAGYPESGYTYTRHGNPTRDRLRERFAGMADAEHVLAAASGMTAISTVCLSVLRRGDRVVASDALFGGTTNFFEEFLDGFGVEVAYVDASDANAVAEALEAPTDLVWVESPTNPLLKLCDIDALGDLADDAGATLVVDNTFATPCGQRPLDLGADVSVLSTTKFVNGHSDSVGGAIATDDDELFDQFAFVLRDMLGAPLSPFDSYLVLRGLKTLPARMARHEHNATRVAGLLADHEAVESVNYPGLRTHPQHALAKQQMQSYGGMVSFELAGDGAEARAVAEDLDVFNLAFSLGGVESLIEHTASMSGAALSAEERAEAGISDSLLRLSVGIENTDDLVRDLSTSLDQV
ncbi:MAG: PLP-dependent aspartate aminotransferase family protein [Halolamina sp.]